MKAIAIGDMHGTFDALYNVLSEHEPDLLLCCGDWGDPGEVGQDVLELVTERAYTFTVFGNHDDLELLDRMRNRDGSPILLKNGEVREVFGVRIGGISGIWAKSHRKPWYVTDEDVISYAERISEGKADVLLAHSCPSGLADMTPSGTHGGKRCFLDAFRIVKPKLYLCGHLHRPGRRDLKDGSSVVNVGFAKEGDFAVLSFDEGLQGLSIQMLSRGRRA